MIPSAVASTPAINAMITLLMSAVVSSPLLNAWWNQRVVKPDIGSVGIVLLLTEKMTSTTSGTNRNATKAQK